MVIVSGCTGSGKAGPNTASAQKESDRYIGWFYDKCLVINVADLSEGTALILIDTQTLQNNRQRAHVISRAVRADECAPLLEDRKSVNAADGIYFYLISRTEKPYVDTSFTFGIAMVSASKNSTLSISEVPDLNNDGLPDSFSSCATSEGISFDVWGSTAYKSQNLWNGYYYLGYDIESTCPDM